MGDVIAVMTTSMRETVSAFEAATRTRLVGAKWKRKRSTYQKDLGEDFFAWLGLNRATKYFPVIINPVIGLCHEPTMRLEAELYGRDPRDPSPTIFTAIGDLCPGRLFTGSPWTVFRWWAPEPMSSSNWSMLMASRLRYDMRMVTP